MTNLPPAQVVKEFLQLTEGLDPATRDAERQRFFGKFFQPAWWSLDPADREEVSRAFGEGVKTPVSADELYRQDLLRRGGDPSNPVQSGGGVQPLGVTIGDIQRNPWNVLASVQDSPMDPMGWLAGGLRGMQQALTATNPTLRAAAIQGLKRASEWGSMGIVPGAQWAGRKLFGIGSGAAEAFANSFPGVFRRPPIAAPPSPQMELPFGAGPTAVPPISGGSQPRVRVRFGPNGIEMQP